MKSILIIDTPKNCMECKLTYYDECNYSCCSLTGEYVYHYKNRSQYCPLSPIPQKRETMQRKDIHGFADGLMYMYDKGWNDCIDEIMKSEDKKC